MQTQNKEMDRAPEQQCSSLYATIVPKEGDSAHGPAWHAKALLRLWSERERAQTGLGGTVLVQQWKQAVRVAPRHRPSPQDSETEAGGSRLA